MGGSSEIPLKKISHQNTQYCKVLQYGYALPKAAQTKAKVTKRCMFQLLGSEWFGHSAIGQRAQHTAESFSPSVKLTYVFLPCYCFAGQG